ncbi:hypothetical protein CR513_46730, partial [Mucuna pruriens]
MTVEQIFGCNDLEEDVKQFGKELGDWTPRGILHGSNLRTDSFQEEEDDVSLQKKDKEEMEALLNLKEKEESTSTTFPPLDMRWPKSIHVDHIKVRLPCKTTLLQEKVHHTTRDNVCKTSIKNTRT